MAYTIWKYLRISAEDIDLDGFEKYESNSIQNQRALLDDFISRIPEFAGCEVMEALDDGRTGTNFSRPGVQRVIEQAQAGKVQCIIVKDLSRWGRNYIEVGDFLEQKFPEWGIRFISLNDAYDSAKLNGATGGIDIAFRNLIYDLYSQDLSEKVRSGKMSAAKSGKFINGFTFYGYIKDPNDTRKIMIDPPTAEVVKRIFDLAAQDYTPNQISKILNDEKVPTAQERKIELGERRRWKKGVAMFWYGSIISVIIRDERYTGKLIYGKKRTAEVGKRKQITVPESDWVVVPDAFPAIISEEQFKAANANVTRRSYPDHKPSKCVLLFTRKLKCGYCGMSLKAVHRQTDVKYKCFTPNVNKDFGCSEDYVFEKDIADTVLAALQRQIAFADEARKMLEAKNEQLKPSIEKLNVEVTRLQRLIEKTKTEKMALWEKYHNRRISAEAFQRETEKADEKAAKYAEKIPEVQAKITAFEMETGRENLFIERFSKQTGLQELTRAAVEEFINEVRVYTADRIEVIFNFSDEYAKIAALVEQPKRKRRAL
jgi:DNA invertase Pin-like site-specific DNA recombinase